MAEPDLSWIDKQAPDPATLERAYALARLNRWQEPGMSRTEAWGAFPTRGALSYRAYASLLDKPHYCNCSSPLYPCKHILALLLLCRNRPDSLRGKQPPGWLPAWKARAENDPSEAEKRQARKKRLDQKEKTRRERLESMQAGARDLLRWTGDLLHLGLAHAVTQPPSFWEEMSARMVDSRLGAVARRIRTWPEQLSMPNGHEALLQALGSEFLLARALLNLDALPIDLRHTVLTRGGFAWKKETVLARPPLRDYWLVVGLEHGDSDNTLFYRRTWLLGSNTGHGALLLDFAHGQPAYEEAWKVGMAVEGSVHFYPGALQIRGLLGEYQLAQDAFTMPAGAAAIREMLDQYAQWLAKDPWLERMPVFLRDVRAFRDGELFHLTDASDKQVDLNTLERSGWQLLALSARQGVNVFGLWDGRSLTPLSAAVSSRVIALNQQVDSAR